MTDTEQKLNEAIIMLNQARDSSNDYTIFIANLNAFVSAARSTTLIMQTEFNSVTGFTDWYKDKQENMKNDKDFQFFNKLRVDTEHVRPFNTPSTYKTTFLGDMTISAGKVVDIPLGKVDNRGNIVVDDQSPVRIDEKPSDSIKRSTTRSYFFTEREGEDAILFCGIYLDKIQKIVKECCSRFQPS